MGNSYGINFVKDGDEISVKGLVISNGSWVETLQWKGAISELKNGTLKTTIISSELYTRIRENVIYSGKLNQHTKNMVKKELKENNV